MFHDVHFRGPNGDSSGPDFNGHGRHSRHGRHDTTKRTPDLYPIQRYPKLPEKNDGFVQHSLILQSLSHDHGDPWSISSSSFFITGCSGAPRPSHPIPVSCHLLRQAERSVWALHCCRLSQKSHHSRHIRVISHHVQLKILGVAKNVRQFHGAPLGEPNTL